LRKLIPLLVVNLVVALAALWLVSSASLSISELIADSWTRQKSLQTGHSTSIFTSGSTSVGMPRGATGSEG